MSEHQRIQHRTVLSTTLLGVFGLAGIILFVRDWTVSLSLVLMYAALVYDTFFSIRYFSSVTSPADRVQQVFDLVLIICYAAIAWNFAHPLGFMYGLSIMFAVASLKYVVLRRRIGPSEILRRKINIDVIGVVAFSAATIPMLYGWIWQVSWALLLLYCIVNVQILWRNPLYPYSAPVQ